MCEVIGEIVASLIGDIIGELRSPAGLVNVAGGLLFSTLIFLYCFVHPAERWVVGVLRWMVSLGGAIDSRLTGRRRRGRLDFPALHEPRYSPVLIPFVAIYFLLCVKIVSTA